MMLEQKYCISGGLNSTEINHKVPSQLSIIVHQQTLLFDDVLNYIVHIVHFILIYYTVILYILILIYYLHFVNIFCHFIYFKLKRCFFSLEDRFSVIFAFQFGPDFVQ